jgi:hypothetical protein
MKTRKYKQRGGSKNPYTLREKTRLRRVGFTDDQIRYLNNIKKEYGPDSLDADGIVYIIQENNNGMTPDLYTASYNKDEYPTYGDTDDEEDTDDEDETQQGGKKRTRRKMKSIYLTKRETRRRRKSIKRTKTARKIYRKTRI